MSDPIPFLRPRLVGERFEGGAIPLEVLKDLAAVEELIVEVAKWSYFQDHPDRKRLPRGFSGGVSLKITEIGDGSAIPVIGLFLASANLVTGQQRIYFEQARDHVIHAIDAAENNQTVTSHLPERLLGYFDRVGRSLRDGEAIEFNYVDPAQPARLTRTTRRKLILASADVQEVSEEVVLRGAIPEFDQEKMTFTLQVTHGPRLSAPVGSQHVHTVLEGFNGYRTGVRVALQGVARFNRYNRLQGIETVEHISLLDPNDIAARIDDFRGLGAGWLDGKGVAPAPEGLDWLSCAFEKHYPDHLPLPYLYPTAEGGVQAEWSLPPYELSLEVSLDKRGGEWHGLNLESDLDTTRQLDLESVADWEWMVREIQDLGGRKPR
ncbi:MAG TPA: hypothetical protein VFJ16_01820 [Longimicrobium sp.]|nr:hypothetical protein [Longimicrobium sp.]